MKRFYTLIIILMTLTACTAPHVKTPEPIATGESKINMPNPAAVYCEQNGYQYEIRTAGDGSQSGVCVFPDGSTCDDWAYFHGECNLTGKATIAETKEVSEGGTGGNASGGTMAPGTAEEISNWWGIIKRLPSGAQFDDCFERQDLGQVILFGIDSIDPEVSNQIKALRNSGRVVHLYGTLLSNVPDCNGSQIRVNRIEFE